MKKSVKLSMLCFLLGSTMIMTTSCNPMGGEKFKVEFKNPTAFKDLKSQISNVTVLDNQLVIAGSTLTNIKTVTLKNDSQEEIFTVESATENQIIANGSRAINFIAGSVFDLILSDAYGAATFQVTFSVSDGAITTAKIANGAVTAAKLDSMGAVAGQYLKFNGTNWIASSLIDGQNYLGTWNVVTNTPDLSAPSTSPGDYYVVSDAGTFNGVNYGIGDWIISDGYNWQKLPYSKTSVSSFQGRKGIVTLVPGDYVSLKDTGTGKITGSNLNDLANIDLTTVAPVAGSILKYNGTKWVAGADNTGIAAGSIVDADISGTADIAQSKISGLATSLSGKQETSSLAADVRAIPLTGLSSTTGAVVAADTILGAFGKLLNAQSDYVSKSSGADIITGTIAVGGTGMITIPTATGTTLTEAANVTYVTNAIAANGVWAKSGTAINYMAGNVGIGTENPTAKLELAGNVDTVMRVATHLDGVNASSIALRKARGTLDAPTIVQNNDRLGFFSFTGYDGTQYPNFNSAVIGAYVDGIPEVGKIPSRIVFEVTPQGSATRVNALTMLNNSNVGVGLTSPAEKLHVLGNIRLQSTETDLTAKVGRMMVGHYQNTEEPLYIFGAASTATDNFIAFGGGSASYNSATQIDFFTAANNTATVGTSRMTIDKNGYVGVGTTTPGTVIEVFSAGNAGGAGTGTVRIAGGSNKERFEARSSVVGAFTASRVGGTIASPTAVNTNDLLGMFIAQGYDGVGYYNASQMVGYAGEPWTTTDHGSYLTFETIANDTTARTEKMRITGSGNVGIGTTNPGATLEVASGTLATGASLGYKFSATLPANPGATAVGARFDVTSAGSDSYRQIGTLYGMNAGYTGSAGTYAFQASNSAAGTANDPLNTGGLYAFGNVAGRFIAAPTTTGANIGVHSMASGGDVNYGSFSAANVAKNSAANIGVAGFGLNTGTSPVQIGGYFGLQSTTPNYTSAALVADNGATTSPIFLARDNGTDVFGIYNDGKVGIGVSAPAEKLEVSGNVKATAFLYSSDRRLKQNIEPLADSLDKILQISGYSYKWKSNSSQDVGVIAQEVEKVFPALVVKSPNGLMSVKYGNFIAPLIEAIKELYAKFVSESEEIKALKADKLEKDAEIASLKQAICEINPMSQICKNIR